MRTLSVQESRPRQEYCGDRPAHDAPSRRTVHIEPQYPPYRHTDRSKQAAVREHTPWEVVYERSPDVTRDQVVPRFKRSRLTARPETETTSSQPSSSVGEVENDVAVEVLVPVKKRQRYLRDVDRHSIVRRIENGEKQATLAREFGVTRAAICHIKKNREEIVSRYESLLESAKEIEKAGQATPLLAAKKERETPSAVQELTQQSVALLLTILRDVTTSHSSFRASADRLMGIVIEEALASVETVAYDIQTSNGQTIRGVKSDRSICCVSVGHKGLPLMRQYRLIDPRGSVGCIQLISERYHSKVVPVAHRVELPREMTADSCVLLFACSTVTGQSVCTAIHALLEIGVNQANIRVVVLVCSSQAAELICHQFPRVRILTCAVESNKNDTPLSTTLSDFLERYEGFQHHTRMPHTAVVRPLPSPFLHARKRPSLSNRWENTEPVRPFVHRQQIRDPRRDHLHG